MRKLNIRHRRGVTLLMVTVSIAILTAVAAEFAFQSRVDLELATHQRDALRAEYLAKSSIGLARMLLLFQKQLDRTSASLPGPLAGMNIQLWRMAKLDCHLLQTVVPQAGAGRRPKFATAGGGGVDEQGRIDYGGFAGCFDARIEDEQEKLNVNALAGLQTGTAQSAVQRFYNLVSDKRFDFVFDREDSNHVRANPADVLIAVKDWEDDDDTQSALTVNALGQATLQNGFSDEAGLYSRYTPRYRPKNSWFDSLGELYLVNGVTDRFMAAFGAQHRGPLAARPPSERSDLPRWDRAEDPRGQDDDADGDVGAGLHQRRPGRGDRGELPGDPAAGDRRCHRQQLPRRQERHLPHRGRRPGR